MKRSFFILLLSLTLFLPGCGLEHVSGDMLSTKTAYPSDTSAEDCYLCSGSIETIIPSYWGQDNIALISLNTFEIEPVEINHYDRLDGRLIEEYSGVASLSGGGSQDGGFSTNMMSDCDRGYATGILHFCDDGTLDIGRAASFLCQDCLNEILPQEIDRYLSVGAIDLATRELRVFEKGIGGFGLGDFYIDWDLEEQDRDPCQMDILIFYCPIRYEDGS